MGRRAAGSAAEDEGRALRMGEERGGLLDACGVGDARRGRGAVRVGPADSVASRRSSGISMCAGRGRSERNSVNARATAAPISATDETRWLKAATFRNASLWLRISCSRPVDWRGWRSGMPGEITSSGTLSE